MIGTVDACIQAILSAQKPKHALSSRDIFPVHRGGHEVVLSWFGSLARRFFDLMRNPFVVAVRKDRS